MGDTPDLLKLRYSNLQITKPIELFDEQKPENQGRPQSESFMGNKKPRAALSLARSLWNCAETDDVALEEAWFGAVSQGGLGLRLAALEKECCLEASGPPSQRIMALEKEIQ